MSTTDTSQGNDSLSSLRAVLNKLAGRERLTLGETEIERKKLADMAISFNGASQPAAEKLAEALPGMTDYGSRWIAAKMLRDSGMKDEAQGEFALNTLSMALVMEKDPGSRWMISSLIRDLGVAHEGLAVPAAAAISGALGREKDPYSRNSQKNSLMTLGLKYEAAAAVAVAGIGKALQDEPDGFARILFAGDLCNLGQRYASQSLAVVTVLAKAALREKEQSPARKLAQHIAEVALRNPSVTAPAIDALAAGVARETKTDMLFGYSSGLQMIGQAHPLPVIVAMENGLAGFKGDENKDKRRICIVDLTSLARLGNIESEAASRVLLKAFDGETESFHRRLIIGGLMACLTNGVDAGPVREGLKAQMNTEKDRETRQSLERSLLTLGFVQPYANVVTFSPVTA